MPEQSSSLQQGADPLPSTSKLTTGDESQKPAIRAPGSPVGVCDYVGENPKADAAAGSTPAEQKSPTASHNRKPIPGKPKHEAFPNIAATAWETELWHLRAALSAYMGGEEPPEGFERSCPLRARGASPAQIEELLDRKWQNPQFRPGRRYGPRKWTWFLAVIGAEFSPIERGRWPEPVAPAHPRNATSADQIVRGIEAIELPDAEGSLVCSYRCKCGAEIRQYTRHIEGVCTCGRRRAPPGRESCGSAAAKG